jgi:nicotinamide riboside kinase
MKYLITISGPVASGKSVLADEVLKRFNTHRISTRQLLIDAGAENDRASLIEAGKRLDRDSDGTWVLEGSRKYIAQNERCDVILIDAVRTERQIDHLREAFGERFVHIHVDVPFEEARVIFKAEDLLLWLAAILPAYEKAKNDPRLVKAIEARKSALEKTRAMGLVKRKRTLAAKYAGHRNRRIGLRRDATAHR